MLKTKFSSERASTLTLSPIVSTQMVRIFVGAECREFTFPSRLVSNASAYFTERLETSCKSLVSHQAQFNTIWLEDVCPDMFELLSYWLLHPRRHAASFQPFIEEAASSALAVDERAECCEDLQWDLVNLHLFAARADIPQLQDAAMDALQDLYLRLDWSISPRLIAHVYGERSSSEEACRLRKWIVAMAAWLLGGDDGIIVILDDKTGAAARRIEALFATCPQFRDDYAAHLSKSSSSRIGIGLHFKNPQLRLPSNNLRNEERQFGFRQCSFHTHRSTVGQGRCPHTLVSRRRPASHHKHTLGHLPVYPGHVQGRSLAGPESPASTSTSDEDDSDLEFLISGTAGIASPKSPSFELYLRLP